VWTHDQEISMPGASGNEHFGSAVALNLDLVVVGAPDESGGGAVVVFYRGTIDYQPAWVPGWTLTNPGVSHLARLGASVGIGADDVIVAGAPEDSSQGDTHGSVTVFAPGGARTTVLAPGLSDRDRFGVSVAIAGETIVGGAVAAEESGRERGVVHVFTTSGAHVQRLTPPNPANGDRFGSGVGIDGGVVVAGASQISAAPADGVKPGVAHVFEDLPAELLCGGFGVTVRGTAGSETLTGTGFRDVIRGYGGDDTLKGLGGNDVICGDDGDDLLLGGPGDDVLYGGDGNDKVRAAAGDDLLDGGPGSDRLLPEAGKDLVNGGGGSDIVDYLAAEGPVSVNLAAGTATYTPVGESPWSQTLVGVEKVDGSSFADTLVGDGKRNLLRGKQGADVIRGGDDDDTLVGGTGADTIHGGDGNDLVKGQADDDRLFGEAGNDRVVGGHGDDELSGGPGNDVLRGGLRSHRGTFVNHLDGGTGTDDCLWPFDVLTNCP
jgi:Ca2+-binding RTX toxin-like protein